MKLRILASIMLILILLTVFLPGCKRASSSLNGSGKIVDQELDIPEFNSVNANGVFNLVIKQGEEFKATVSLDDNLMGRLKILVDRYTLKLSVEAPATFFPTSLKVNITMPQLLALNLAGGARAAISGFKSPDDFTLFMNEKGLLEGAITAKNLVFNLAGDSKAVLSGSALKLELNSRGASILDMHDYNVMRAQIKLDEASSATLNVSGQFDVELIN